MSVDFPNWIHGKPIHAPDAEWRASVTNRPDLNTTGDRVCYRVTFRHQGAEERRLKLWVSQVRLLTEESDVYIPKVVAFIHKWLESGILDEERECFS